MNLGTFSTAPDFMQSSIHHQIINFLTILQFIIKLYYVMITSLWHHIYLHYVLDTSTLVWNNPNHHVPEDFKLKSETGTTPPQHSTLMSHVPDSIFIWNSIWNSTICSGNMWRYLVTTPGTSPVSDAYSISYFVTDLFLSWTHDSPCDQIWLQIQEQEE